jgi:hypothetical protein
MAKHIADFVNKPSVKEDGSKIMTMAIAYSDHPVFTNVITLSLGLQLSQVFAYQYAVRRARSGQNFMANAKV